MSDINVEDWMHSSDEERTETIQSWDTEKGEGQKVVSCVATLFKGECIYNVLETIVSVQNGEWIIDAFSETDDYETLKKRKAVRFLGFDIDFKHIDEY